jgi:hypothetical protein
MAERDRDESGRPRSARPRDAFGRPLPQGVEGIARIPDDLELPPAESLAYAQDLLDQGLAFNAHEVLEAAWKNGPDDERMLWQGLAQLAVGLTHVPPLGKRSHPLFGHPRTICFADGEPTCTHSTSSFSRYSP